MSSTGYDTRRIDIFVGNELIVGHVRCLRSFEDSKGTKRKLRWVIQQSIETLE